MDNRVVSYVVGTFLCFPLRVLHILPPPEEKPEEKPIAKPSEDFAKKTRAKAPLSQQGVKRVCGNAQKSVRMKHKK